MASSYATDIIKLSLTSEAPILRFGSFTLKSGRQSPYFFNFGLFNTGPLLLHLATAFADAIEATFPGLKDGDKEGTGPQVLFGPAYKGIPLAAAVSAELARRGISLGFSYNRKEAKDHGEGGSIVGFPLGGLRVLIIDDVITAGTAIRQAHEFVKAEGGRVVGIVEALDREERTTESTESAVQSVERELGVKVISVVKMRDIVEYIKAEGKLDVLADMEAYRKEYGV